MSIYGLAGKFLFADTPLPPSAYAAIRLDHTPLTLADLSTYVGLVTTVAGALYSWFLLQKTKREKQERDRAEQDQMMKIRLMVAEGIAGMQLENAKLHARIEGNQAKKEDKPDGNVGTQSAPAG
jgi:hypothetical protein